MKEIHLEPWETITDRVKQWLPLIEQRLYPELEGEPEVGKFYRLYPEGCVSGNQGPYHGVLRVGKEKDKLIVFFNGGGVSWNEYTAARPNGLFSGNLKEAFYFNETEWLGDGVLENGIGSSREDNPFRDWSIIDMPYGTGDFHCGNGDFPYTALDGTSRILPHHGYRNALAVIEMAKQWVGEPKQLLIAGNSAGGFGVSLMAEDVIRQFPGCEDITCLVDSSILLKEDWAEIAKEVWHAPEHIYQRLHTDNITLDSYTTLYKSFGKRVRCLFDCSVRDMAITQCQNALDGKGMIFDHESGERTQRELKKMCSQLNEVIPGVGLYISDSAAGEPQVDSLGLTCHCFLEDERFFSYKVEGKSVCDWLWNSMNGKTEQIGLKLLDNFK